MQVLYHGSQVESLTPTYGLGNDTHDYGHGFYTTADKLPVESLCAVYPGAHDLDLNTAVEKLGRPVFVK